MEDRNPTGSIKDRAALSMLDAAEATVNSMPEGAEKIVVLSAWNTNASFERTYPTSCRSEVRSV
jgi:cysteine synthase